MQIISLTKNYQGNNMFFGPWCYVNTTIFTYTTAQIVDFGSELQGINLVLGKCLSNRE